VEIVSAISRYGHFLLTDSVSIGAVGWLGLVITIGGFAIAIYQIRRTRDAAESAENAAKELTKAVFGRERLIELTSAIAHVNNAKDRIAQGRYETALVFIDFALTECVKIHVLLDNPERKKFYKDIVRLRKLGEDVSFPQGKDTDNNAPFDLALEARAIAEALNEMAAKLRYNYNVEGYRR
jgi:hypothetical protein